MNTTLNETINDVMTKQRAGQFTLLKKLVQTATETRSAGLLKSSEKIATLLEALDFEVDRHAPDKDRLEALGRLPLQNLVARKSFGDGPVLAFVSYVDTADAHPGWTFEPLGGEIVDGRLYGLGAVSGKGDLAAQIYAVEALTQIGATLKGTIELHIRAALTPATTRTMIMNVEVRGKTAPAHAPEAGADALEAASHALSRLYQFRGGLKAHASEVPGLGAPSLVVETISGGDETGGVPDFVTFRIDRRLMPDEDPVQVEKQLTNLIGSTIAKMPGTRCRIRRSVLIPAMGNDSNTENLVSVLSKHLEAISGMAGEARGIAHDHEGRHYAAAGIPTVMYGAGPLDVVEAGLHSADENIALDDLRLATQILALAALELLS